MDAPLPSPALIVALGFALGGIFGFVASKTNFCTMGAISDVVHMGEWTRMRTWIVAIALAVLGVMTLQATGLVDASKSIYVTNRLPWLSHVVGGALFGVGMTLAGGCTSKTLIRIGGGNYKSLIVSLVVGITAYVTLKGLFGVLRVNALDAFAIPLATPQDLPTLVAATFGLSPRWTAIAVPAAVGCALLAFGFARREMWRVDTLLAGVVVALTVVAGWYVTGHVGYVAEHPDTLQEAFIATQGNRPESLSLVAPYAYTIELLMFWSDASRHVTFGIATAAGIVVGSFAWAVASRTLREESFRDAVDLKRHVAGGMLMGFGGVTALGCTIGQGLTGVSTLAVGSMITLAAIIGGAAAMMKLDYWWFAREAATHA
jgi:uncharacterized membrane protein YedE/YeeE